ncbi:hypothetical protein KI659_09675 [Litoribacter alkaliphilus]|uniref:Uncharacterized protein n=1 Tax=Litoribacter ruber TaxID=702568 RepID=A0AAP2CGM8_9BACT|nr:hypothetical protein [Litoribacter alkaliphilus]MBS9524283.1 hypothetical protein [Litoribacter alkaliphilus]
MKIEKIDNEIVIRVSDETDLTGLERLLDFLKLRETTSKSKITAEQIDELSKDIKTSWWEKNKAKFLK